MTSKYPTSVSDLQSANPLRRSWSLSDASLHDVRTNGYEVAILPLGATEPHNLHLPYATDTIQVDKIADELGRRAWQAGGKVVVLPPLPYGTESNLEKFPLAMNLSPTTVFGVLNDLLESLEKSGIRKVFLLNGHGGNDLKAWLRQVHGKTACQVFLCNWYTVLKDISSDIFEHPEDHAGEMETSLILAIQPNLVRRTSTGELAADQGAVREFRFEALKNGWVGITRPWHLLTTNSGSGNPHAASAEKGRATIEKLCDRLVPFLVELSHSSIDDTFPFH